MVSYTGLAELDDEIQALIRADQQANSPTVDVATLHDWRTRLDALLRDLEDADPCGWARARQPGTWLDNHLRLRSLLAHEVAKAYWDSRIAIDYASIDIERYLWGAR
jgi:hypothetical protein